MSQFWELPGDNFGTNYFTVPVMETIPGWSLFWYCFECGSKYAKMDTTDQPWKAIAGCCPYCPGNRFCIPGTLETTMLLGWKVPLEVARYQLEREIDFWENNNDLLVCSSLVDNGSYSD